MYISHDTLDDLMRDILERLLEEQAVIKASRGDFREMFGACLHLRNPRARLSRSEGKGKLFSALGELFWYLSGDTKLDFIDYYVPNRFQEESDDQVRVRSGYGERLLSFRGVNQLKNVIRLLDDKQTSRRAVIQLFDATDLSESFASIPCTCTLQFLARDSRLHLFVAMRSNDAFFGLPHDVFSFTMLQELVARSIGLEVGEYKHCAGSLHLYEDDKDQAVAYINEGLQSTLAMPSMPIGDPWVSVAELQKAEEKLRGHEDFDVEQVQVDSYWKDFARLFAAYRASRARNLPGLISLKERMGSDVYKMFIQPRIDRLTYPDLNAKRA